MHDGQRVGYVPSEPGASAAEEIAETDRDEDVERGGAGEANREDKLSCRDASDGGRCLHTMTYVVALHEARVALERYPVGGRQSIRVCLGRRQGTYISDVDTRDDHRVSALHGT